MHSKKCKFCNEIFLLKRIDQLFCSMKCRNAFNNSTYKKRTDYYRALAYQLMQQDELIDSLVESNGLGLIHRNEIESFGIELDCSRKLIVNDKGNILEVKFRRFKFLYHTKDIYRICRIQNHD